MKLASLPDVAREAMWKGDLSHSTALLLARIPDPGLQKEATLKKCLHGDYDEGSLSYLSARGLIEYHLHAQAHGGLVSD